MNKLLVGLFLLGGTLAWADPWQAPPMTVTATGNYELGNPKMGTANIGIRCVAGTCSANIVNVCKPSANSLGVTAASKTFFFGPGSAAASGGAALTSFTAPTACSDNCAYIGLPPCASYQINVGTCTSCTMEFTIATY